jgi:hypothetical protein
LQNWVANNGLCLNFGEFLTIGRVSHKVHKELIVYVLRFLQKLVYFKTYAKKDTKGWLFIVAIIKNLVVVNIYLTNGTKNFLITSLFL